MNAPPPAANKKPPTDKQLKMKANRANALKNLTARLGKPARAPNAARLVTLRRNKPEEAEKFIDDLIAREGKPVLKPKANKAKNTTLKAASNGANKKKVNKYFTFKYNSVEREAKRIIKKADELEKLLKPLGHSLKDVCKLCKDLRED